MERITDCMEHVFAHCGCLVPSIGKTRAEDLFRLFCELLSQVPFLFDLWAKYLVQLPPAPVGQRWCKIPLVVQG